MSAKFDELIRNGRDTDAMRFLAQEYYDNGKMGHTRKLLLERVADKLDESQRREQAAVDDLKLLRDCGVCRRDDDGTCGDYEGCNFDWRGPQEGEKDE
ncbi:Hypothetical protein DPCES_1393 [Desulfitobacterium hafniense]|uniref:Uncharacterized protein n=1 Tax=Desulfitobacterium hafniense TaxID=49338 RepID=A0A098AYT5_DESHA|nr:hypothetical protein [Desulfitobacterium hafniense]CDX01280.1 Hypothetical protein DPCES_1393 [Desulfitobacterium hafniense]